MTSLASLLTNRSFQVFFGGLAAIGALIALMTTHTIPSNQGLPLLTVVVGYVLGVPVQVPAPAAAVVAPAPVAPAPAAPAPVATQSLP